MSSSALQKNLAASFLGLGWLVVVQLVCVPLYVAVIGVEAWALVGVHLTLTATLLVLDFGMTPTMNRVLARGRTLPGREAEGRDFARTLEAFYWLLGLAIGGAVVLLAPLIATRWVHPRSLSVDHVESAVRWMGAVIAVQWPVGLYAGGLQGLELQGRLNGVRAGAATLAGFGAVAVLTWGSPDVRAYFQWQLAVGTLQLLVLALVFWRSMPPGPRPRVVPALLRVEARFALGVAGTTALGVLLLQLDKLVVSNELTLEVFGHYALATTIVGGLQLFIRPVYSAVFPRLTALASQRDDAAMAEVYHQGTQLLAACLAPISVVLIFFGDASTHAWVGDATLASHVGPIVAVTVAGTAAHGMLHLPYALQLASGWTRIGFFTAAVQLAIFLPLLVLGVRAWGPLGAGAAWTAIHVATLAVVVPLTHRRLQPGQTARWFLFDLGAPVLAATIAVMAVRALAPPIANRATAFAVLTAAVLASMAASFAASPLARGLVRRRAG